MAFCYLLYGLHLRSNLSLPGLWHSEPGGGVDVEISFGKLHQHTDVQREPWYVSPYLDESGKPYLIVWKSPNDSTFHFVYGDETEFLVDRSGTRVSAIWPEWLNLENTTVYLAGQISAFILRLRGRVCLHASSIVVDGKVLAIAGESGAGKSLTAASFVRLGYSILSEDVTTLMDGSSFLVQPGYPRVNLWPDAVACLRGITESLPRIAPTWNKRYLDLREHGDRFYPKPAPLGGVYVLGRRSSSQSAPFIEKLNSSDALIALLTNAHGRYLLEKRMRVREFELLSRVASQIPIRHAVAHTDLTQLDELCQAMIEDFKVSLTSHGTETAEASFV